MKGRRISFGIKAVLGVAVALLAVAGPAQAVPRLIFDQEVDGGQVDFSSGGPLVGTDIAFQIVTAFETPLNAGVTLYCDGACLLNFETGDLISESGGEYEWAGGGFYTLTGDLWTAPGGALGGGILIATGTLLDGSWDTGVEGDIMFIGGDPVSINIEGNGTDTKHEDLVAFFGLGPNFQFGQTEISSNVTGYTPGEGGSFEADVVEADLANFPTTAVAVPEPGTLLLLGLGLSGLGLYSRKRQ